MGKFKFGIVVLCIGFLIMIAEVFYVQYLSGHEIMTAQVANKETEAMTVTLDLREEDLPVRAVLTAEGRQPIQRTAGRPFAEFTFDYGGAAQTQEMRFVFAAEEEIQTTRNLRKTQSFALRALPVGIVDITVSRGPFNQFRVDQMTAKFVGGGRTYSVALLALSALIIAIGSVMMWAGRRQPAP